MSTYTELIDITLGVIREVFKHTDEQVPFEQAVHEEDGIEMFAIRIKTGFEASYILYNEIRFVSIPRLKPSKFQELREKVLAWKPFVYRTGHEKCFGTTIFIFPEKIKGVFKARLMSNSALGKIAIVVMDPRVGEDKLKASYFAYLVSYFCQRSSNLLAKLMNKKPSKTNIWYRVRSVFAGKLDTLSGSLTNLYYYIDNRVESFRVNNSASNELIKTMTILNDLFYKFAKAFDKFGKNIYLREITKKARNALKQIVPSRLFEKILEKLLEESKRLTQEAIMEEAMKILNAHPVIPDPGG